MAFRRFSNKMRYGKRKNINNWYIGFSVVCDECGYVNLPDKSPRISAEKVLSGRFTKCKNCHKKFIGITVYLRPLVVGILDEGFVVDPTIRFEEYLGNVPAARGQTVWGMEGDSDKPKIFGYLMNFNKVMDWSAITREIEEIEFYEDPIEVAGLDYEFDPVVPERVRVVILG